MKLKYFIIAFYSILSISCVQKESLTPSGADTRNLLDLLDKSKPLVKDYYEKYGTEIYTNFSDTLDFKFGFYTYNAGQTYKQLNITMLPQENIDWALNAFNDMVLKYIKEEVTLNGVTYKNCPLIKKLPRKILIADNIELGNLNPNSSVMNENAIIESGSVTTIYSKYSYMFGFNKTSMDAFSSTQLKRLRDVKLYNLLTYIFDNNNFYSLIPETFSEKVKHLYGTSVNDLANSLDPLPVGTGPYSSYYLPEWYTALGMALTRTSPSTSYTSSLMNYRQTMRISNVLTFPDQERDFRNFMYVMLYVSSSDLTTYYLNVPLAKERMRIFLETVASWGVDVLAINADMAKFFN